MTRPLLAFVLLALAPLAGCMAPAEGVPDGTIPFETIDAGINSEVEERDEVVVRDAEAWKQLWDRHAPDDERPEIDFDEQMVVAIFKGESPDGCHGAEIENVTGDGERVHVEGAYFEVTDASCIQQITYPFHIVALDHYEGEVVFDVREEQRQKGDSQPDDGSGDRGSYTCRAPTEGSGGGLTSAQQVEFETIAEGGQSGIEEACATVAANETAWRDLWTAHQSHAGEPDDRPQVNFDERIVVAIFKGESPSTCHGAEIENVTRDGLDVVVHGVFYEIEGQACGDAITYPFHIVDLDRPEGEVVFDVREETRQA